MRIDRKFTFTVDAVPRIILGDVDGNRILDLRDLILLAKFVRGEIDSLPNPEAGNIISRPGSPNSPNLSDLNALARYFAGRDDSGMPAP